LGEEGRAAFAYLLLHRSHHRRYPALNLGIAALRLGSPSSLKRIIGISEEDLPGREDGYLLFRLGNKEEI
jgi:hypothetical protein